MRRLLAVFAVVAVAAGGEESGPFAGAWKTPFGPLVIEVKGEEASGTVGPNRLPLKGKVDGKELVLGYDEGQVHVDAKLTLEASGHAFRGTFKAANGRQGLWNGWRPDPTAAQGPAADISGLWLTDLGLMELTQDGEKVLGRYALRGTSSLKGTLHGRHLDFRTQAFRNGPGWFDLDAQSKRLAGAAGTDGQPGWHGWTGRRAPEFARHARLLPGTIVEGSTDGLLTYAVRAPENYQPDAKRKWPVVVILHGSNMNAKAYVNTLASAWPDLAREFILLGLNGETPSRIDGDTPSFNYTYINYVGRSTFGGFPGTDRESPALVGEALAELRRVYPVKHYLVGGHSQGGFLTYSLLMNSPEAIAGAFPISAGVIFQCEPLAFADLKLKAAQRAVPLAIVHGRNDPVVSFATGEYAANLFGDSSWPALRFLTDDDAGHLFARLPVGPAIRWLEALASDDPATLLAFAERRLNEAAPRDAIAATRRLEDLTLDPEAQQRLDRILKAIEEQAAPRARTFLTTIQADKDGSWVDDFLSFRQQYEFARSAADAMAAFNALRARHDPPAKQAINEARSLFRKGQRDQALARSRDVVDRYYASTSYRLARTWLAQEPDRPSQDASPKP